MINNGSKNPLKLVSIIFSVATVPYILFFVLFLAKGNTLTEAIIVRRLNIIGLCLCGLFIVCYLWKNILAWWIALLDIPIMFVCSTLIKDYRTFNRKSIFAFVVVFSAVLYYLKSKYAAYKEYVSSNDQSANLQSLAEDRPDLSKRKKLYDPQNPLHLIFVAAVILGLTAYYNIISVKVTTTVSQEMLIGYSYQAAKLSMVFIFILCYWTRIRLAWWIALMYCPVIWLIYCLFQHFNMPQLILAFCCNAIAVWYMIVKYKPYHEYIKQVKTSE